MLVLGLGAVTIVLAAVAFRATYVRLVSCGFPSFLARKRALWTAAGFLGLGVLLGMLVRLLAM